MPKLTPKEKYHNAIIDINSRLSSVLNPMRESVKDHYAKTNSAKINDVMPCGNVERQPAYSSGDEALGNTRIDQVINEIKSHPDKWGELQEISPDSFNVGSGSGNMSERVPVAELIYPKWLSLIDTEAKLFFRRSKSKDYYDEESLSRGVPRRKKVKKHVKMRSLFVLLDVSGSMWQGSYKGIPLIELMIRYFPAIANKFEGELWEVDDGSPSVIIPLKQLRGSNLKEMNIVGGGGTNYDEAFRMLADKKKLLEASGKNPEFLTIVFTDGEVYWNEDLLPENLLILAPRMKEKDLPPDDADKKRRSILIEVDEN